MLSARDQFLGRQRVVHRDHRRAVDTEPLRCLVLGERVTLGEHGQHGQLASAACSAAAAAEEVAALLPKLRTIG